MVQMRVSKFAQAHPEAGPVISSIEFETIVIGTRAQSTEAATNSNNSIFFIDYFHKND